MAIKNYTTKVDVYQSMGEIQASLAQHGARKIMVDYDEEGIPSGIAFGILTPEPKGFLLPANADGVLKVTQKQKVKVDREQAQRIAWRNVRDWVLAQMALLEAGQVEMEEIFLPYLTDGRGKTLYQAYRQGGLMLTDGEEYK